MQFSDTTNKNGILQLCESLLNLGDTAITGNTTLKAQFTGFVNITYGKVFSAILQTDKNFRADDGNYTNFPISIIDLADNQRDYTLPASTVGGNFSTFLRLNRLKVRDTSGNRHDCQLMENSDEEASDKAFPTKFRILGNSVRFQNPVLASSVYSSGTGALEIEFQRLFDEFTTSDTTQQPFFPALYHSVLAYGPCALYAEGTGDFARSDRFTLKTEQLIKDVATHYANMVQLDNQPIRKITALKQDCR